MESTSGQRKGASDAERSEGSLLTHSLGNAVAVLFLDLDAMRLSRENAREFQAAHDSMRKELQTLKELLGRVSAVLGGNERPMSAVESTGRDAASEGASPKAGGAAAPGRGGGASDAVIIERKAAIRVLCVDDKADITDILRMIIDSEEDMKCVGSLDSADNLLAEVGRLCGSAGTDAKEGALLVLMDASMPGKDPMKVLGEVASAVPQARMIVYSGHDGPEFVTRAREAGAWRCISKHEDPETLLRMLREVARATRPSGG